MTFYFVTDFFPRYSVTEAGFSLLNFELHFCYPLCSRSRREVVYLLYLTLRIVTLINRCGECHCNGACKLLQHYLWSNCNGTQWNAVSPPPIYGSKRSPPQIVIVLEKGTRPRTAALNLNVPFPHVKFCTLITRHT